MNLKEVQAVYFLLNNLSDNKYSIKLYVENQNKIFSADFLDLSSSKRSVIHKDFDYEFCIDESRIDIRNGSSQNYLWAIASRNWLNPKVVIDYSEKQFSNPAVLLQTIVNFVKKISESHDSIEFSNIAYNVHYQNSEPFDFCLLPKDNYEILTMKVSKN